VAIEQIVRHQRAGGGHGRSQRAVTGDKPALNPSPMRTPSTLMMVRRRALA
jgi:hypothetical protein